MIASVNTKKILIVDDEKDLSSLYKLRFEAEGFEVLYCENVDIALKNIHDFKPNLVMLDLMMPHLSGLDALELLRSHIKANDIHTVIYSALSKPGDIERAKQLGADDYIVKSNTSFAEVIERIKTIVNSPLPTTLQS